MSTTYLWLEAVSQLNRPGQAKRRDLDAFSTTHIWVRLFTANPREYPTIQTENINNAQYRFHFGGLFPFSNAITWSLYAVDTAALFTHSQAGTLLSARDGALSTALGASALLTAAQEAHAGFPFSPAFFTQDMDELEALMPRTKCVELLSPCLLDVLCVRWLTLSAAGSAGRRTSAHTWTRATCVSTWKRPR